MYVCVASSSVSKVSIPQAVSTVATIDRNIGVVHKDNERFNTASGKHCCNLSSLIIIEQRIRERVSIPQAVSTVATLSKVASAI